LEVIEVMRNYFRLVVFLYLSIIILM